MKHKFGLLYSWLVRVLTAGLPDAPICMRFRGWCYGLLMQRRGRDFQVSGSARLVGLESISVGRHVYVGPGAILLASHAIELGDEVMLAPYVVLADGNHTLYDGSYRYGPRATAPLTIGQGAWIAAHCTVVAGVSIGRGVLVAANSVVTSDVPDFRVVGGVPARVLRLAAVADGPLPTQSRPGSQSGNAA